MRSAILGLFVLPVWLSAAHAEEPYQKAVKDYLDAGRKPWTVEAWHKPQPLAGMGQITYQQSAKSWTSWNLEGLFKENPALRQGAAVRLQYVRDEQGKKIAYDRVFVVDDKDGIWEVFEAAGFRLERGADVFVEQRDPNAPPAKPLSLDETLELANTRIKENPGVAEHYVMRARAQILLGEYEKAKQDLTKVLDLEPRNAEAYRIRGNIWFVQGDLEKASADLADAVRLGPDNSKSHWLFGSVLGLKKENDKAIAEFSEAIRLAPRDPHAYIARGTCWQVTGANDKAEADYSAAIEIDPQAANAYYCRASVRAGRGAIDRAIDDYGIVLKLDPGHVFAANALAWIFATCDDAQHRNGAKAVELARRACELTEWKDSGCLETLAAASAENGDFKAAVERQQQALDLIKGDGDRAGQLERLKLYQAGKPFRVPAGK